VGARGQQVVSPGGAGRHHLAERAKRDAELHLALDLAELSADAESAAQEANRLTDDLDLPRDGMSSHCMIDAARRLERRAFDVVQRTTALAIRDAGGGPALAAFWRRALNDVYQSLARVK